MKEIKAFINGEEVKTLKDITWTIFESVGKLNDNKIKTYFGFVVGTEEETHMLWEGFDLDYTQIPQKKMFSAFFAYEIKDGIFKAIKSRNFDKTFDELSMRKFADEWVKENPIPKTTIAQYDSFDFRTGNWKIHI